MSGMDIISGNEIRTKLELLTSRMRHLQEQRDVLLQENARLAESLEQTRKQLDEEKNRTVNMTEKLSELQDPESEDPDTGKRTEIREKIKELAEEIDKCITLLNTPDV